MATESCSKASEEPMAAAAAAVKQRRKRKWDQPAECLISAGLAVPGPLPLITGSFVAGAVMGPSAISQLPSSVQSACVDVPRLLQQNAAALIQKLSQPTIQDELIAREIIINDADPMTRYKLTKRQTQDEIQKFTGAVVITRGMYRPPNGLPDSEKPLYLHISAGAHLKDTAERIKAVDRASSMVEEILKHGQNLQPGSESFDPALINGHAAQLLSTCVYLGFDPDPSLNIAARIHGPNDQYISHIMNVTGATVVLRGCGSEKCGSSPTADAQPLHLFLSSNSSRSLEEARILAENLLDTICSECGTFRTSSSKVYNAVPPPQQLSVGVQSKTNDAPGKTTFSSGSICSTTSDSSVSPTLSTVSAASTSAIYPLGTMSQPGVAIGKPNLASCSHVSVCGGTSYAGYGGIYPQATALQQVALALRHVPASTPLMNPILTTVTSSSQVMTSSVKTNASLTNETDKRPQRRKFQELPSAPTRPLTSHQNLHQDQDFFKSGASSGDMNLSNVSSMPPPKELMQSRSLAPQISNSMPPPPSRNTTLPPPPKFIPSQSSPNQPSAELVSDTLKKLMEYGDDDEDIADNEVSMQK